MNQWAVLNQEPSVALAELLQENIQQGEGLGSRFIRSEVFFFSERAHFAGISSSVKKYGTESVRKGRFE